MSAGHWYKQHFGCVLGQNVGDYSTEQEGHVEDPHQGNDNASEEEGTVECLDLEI